MLVDFVLAKNHPWIGTNYTEALSSGKDSKWNRRFNINLGIYF
jgi:Txe/YoeB family toxin of Txe-Axe toxin-antitoxin module